MEIQDRQFKIQGIPLLAMADRYGLPLYVYDSAQIKRKYDELTQTFSSLRVKIRYACKALSNLNILRLLKSWGCGLDTVSIQEVEVGLMAGFDPGEIIFTPNCVSFEEIERAVGKKVMVNIDDLSILEQFGNRYGSGIPCCIRLNPNILAGGNPRIQTGHIDSKFGISIYQMRHLVRLVDFYKIDVRGLHIHTGSEIQDPGVFLQMADVLYEAAANFPSLSFLDFGGGFKVAYKEEDKNVDLEGLAQKLVPGFVRFCEKYGKPLEIWFEPGKFLVSEAGVLLVKTNVIKQTVSSLFAGVDAGLNHLIRPMLYNAYHKILNVSNPDREPRVYHVVGYICETDTLACDRKIPAIEVGDVLCICNAGAYGFSMSSNYNSRLRPAEVMIHNRRDYLIRKRETLEDILKNQMIVEVEDEPGTEHG